MQNVNKLINVGQSEAFKGTNSLQRQSIVILTYVFYYKTHTRNAILSKHCSFQNLI